MRYGVRKPKHILLCLRNEIANDFKAEYPRCKYKISVMISMNDAVKTTARLKTAYCNLPQLVECARGTSKQYGSSLSYRH